jgi:WD40 repeat protein
VSSLASSGEGSSTACAFSPDGSLVFLATAAGKLASWSTKELSQEREYPGTSGTVRSIAVSIAADESAAASPGGLVAAGGDDMHLRVWSTSGGTPLADLMTHAPITGLQFARGGRVLIASGSDGILRHYELSRTGEKLALELSLQSRGHVGAIRRLVVPTDDQFAFSVAADGKILSWRVADSRPRWQREFGRQPIGALAFRPDAQMLIAGSSDGMLRELSTADGSTAREWPHEGGALAAAFRPDGQELATAGRDGTLRVWDAERKEAAKLAVAPAGSLHTLEWSADGALLQVAGRNKLWQTFERSSIANPQTQPVRQIEGHNHPIVALRYSVNRQRVATLDDSGKLFVWDAGSGASLFHQQLEVKAAYGLAWSPDASEIAIATSDPRVLRVTLPAAAR